MENINKKTLILGSVVAVLIAIFVAYSFYSRSARQTRLGSGTIGSDESEIQPERQGPFPTITKEEIKPSEKIIVPEIGATVAKEVAAPTDVQPAAPIGDSKNRTFQLKMENDKFTPNTVIVKTGDNVNIWVTAVDKDYDFFLGDVYGLITPIIKGETKKMIFQAWQTGKFSFYCKTCGGLDSTAVGTLIVAP